MFFQMAWRNIWRNPKRTIIIIIAISIGVWFMVFTGAFMRGSMNGMIENGINTLTGHIQIHHKDYRNDPVVENSMSNAKEVESSLHTLPNGSLWSSRVRVNAIANNARHTNGVTLVGIDPEQEKNISFIGQSVIEGRYLNKDDRIGIVIGKALADKFETSLNKKIILMSQDSDNEIASRAFRIIGLFKTELEATEKQFVFITKSTAQEMLKLKDGISEISIILPERKDDYKVASSLKTVLPKDNYEVHTWQELIPFLRAYLKIYDGMSMVWYVIIFIAMAFGIVNTLLMAVFERIREFGLFKALGMKPWWIIREVLTESSFLLIIGMAIGNALNLISVLTLFNKGIDLSAFAAGTEYYGMSRVIYPILHGKDMFMANMVVVILGLFISLYPAVKAARFTPIEALTHT